MMFYAGVAPYIPPARECPERPALWHPLALEDPNGRVV